MTMEIIQFPEREANTTTEHRVLFKDGSVLVAQGDGGEIEGMYVISETDEVTMHWIPMTSIMRIEQTELNVE